MAVPGIVKVRATWGFCPYLELVVAPEYRFALYKDKGYGKLSSALGSVKGWANGFGIHIGLAVSY